MSFIKLNNFISEKVILRNESYFKLDKKYCNALDSKMRITNIVCFLNLIFLVTLTSQVDTLTSYNELKSFNVDKSDTVFIDHIDYEGLFVKSLGPATIDGGVNLPSSSVVYYWKRQIDNKTYRPEWWPYNPEYSSQQIQYAINVSSSTDTVLFKENKEYLIDRTVRIKKGRTLKGINSVLKRKNMLGSRLKKRAYSGDSILIANNTDILKTNMILFLVDETSENNGKSYLDNSRRLANDVTTILRIHGDTIVLRKGIALPFSKNLDSLGFYEIGTPLFHPETMFVAHTTDSDSILIEGLIFDGNSDEIDINYDWRVLGILAIAGFSKGHIVRNCIFRNTNSECIILSKNSIIENCVAYNLGGSFVHISNPSGFSGVIIRNNEIEDVNLNTNKLAAHSEGAITFSAHNTGVLVEHNLFLNGKEGILGTFLGDDDNLTFRNNNCKNFKSVLFNKLERGDKNSAINIIKNDFENCGKIRFISFDTSYISGIDIIENSLINTSIELFQADSVYISGNDFLMNDTILTDFINSDSSFVNVERNTFISDEFSINDTIFHIDGGHVACNIIDAPFAKLTFNIEANSNMLIESNFIRAVSVSNLDSQTDVFTNNVIFGDSIQVENFIDNNILVSTVEEFDSYLTQWDALNCNLILSNEDLQLSKQIEVFPNPASSFITIYQRFISDKNIDYTLIDLCGNILKVGDISISTNLIDLSDLKSGLYFLNLKGYGTAKVQINN